MLTIREGMLSPDIHISRLGERKSRVLVGSADATESFLHWSGEKLRPVMQRGDTWPDTLVLVDCRAGDRSVDILIGTHDGGRVVIRLRAVDLTDARLRWLAKEVLHHAWVDFNV